MGSVMRRQVREGLEFLRDALNAQGDEFLLDSIQFGLTKVAQVLEAEVAGIGQKDPGSKTPPWFRAKQGNSPPKKKMPEEAPEEMEEGEEEAGFAPTESAEDSGEQPPFGGEEPPAQEAAPGPPQLGPDGQPQSQGELLSEQEESGPEVFDKVGAAKRELEGKSEMVEQLRQQAEEAEESHDPENLRSLIDNLKTFLEEELSAAEEDVREAETEQADEGDQMAMEGQSPVPGAEPNPFAAQGEPGLDEQSPFGAEEGEAQEGDVPLEGEEPAVEADETGFATDEEEGWEEEGWEDEEEGSPAEESSGGDRTDDPFGGEYPEEEEQMNHAGNPAQEAGASITCEACGHSMTPQKVAGPARESASPVRESKTSANSGNLTSDERAELVALRAREKMRTQLTKARDRIREAGVILQPKDLVRFDEGQWDTLIRMASALPSEGAPEQAYFPVRESGAENATNRRSYFENLFGLEPATEQ